MDKAKTLSYADYRKNMEAIVYKKRKLIESMALKKKAYQDYKLYLDQEKKLREELFTLIPETW
jgi:vacuolar-type H+-ATPase subunit C/Vma6